MKIKKNIKNYLNAKNSTFIQRNCFPSNCKEYSMRISHSDFGKNNENTILLFKRPFKYTCCY